MARRGQFGRLPSAAPSYGSLIISIARQMQAEQDATLMDSWAKGGTFNGKKTTDSDVLKYWKARMANLSEDDPKYEEIKDQVGQIEYGIAQSKQDVLYRQGKISDAQYASFFLNWSKKVPKDSEFYRTLQKDAANLIESSKARGAASANKAKVDSYNKFVGDITASKITTGNALRDAVLSMAQSSGLDLEANGDQILDLLTQDFKSNPAKYKSLHDALRVSDPGFNGTITSGFFAKEMQNATDGYSTIADRAKKDGYASNYASAAKASSEMAVMAADIKVWPVAKTYDNAYNAFVKIWQDPNASQPDKDDAAKAFSAVATKLARDPNLDPTTKQMLTADSTRLLGGTAGDTVSFAAITGRGPIDDSTAGKIKFFADQKALMDVNPGAYVYAPVDTNGQYDASGKGNLGIVPVGVVGDAAQVVVTGLNGKAVVASITQHPIYAVNPQDPNDKRIVGASVSYHNGGKVETQYSYSDANGQTRWSDAEHAPWAVGVVPQVDSKGDVYLIAPVPSPANVLAQAQAIDAIKGTHLASLIGEGSTNVKQTFLDKGATITVTFKDGQFTSTKTIDEQVNGKNTGASTTQAFDLNSISAGAGPFPAAWQPSDVVAASRYRSVDGISGVTFTSPLAVSMHTASSAMSRDQTDKLAGDPTFQQAFLQQTMAFTGAATPADARVVDAWKEITAIPRSANEIAFYHAAEAHTRRDLTYPGARPSGEANKGSVSINFGGQTVKVPNLPSFMGNQNNVDLSGVAGLAGQGASFLQSLGVPIPAPAPAAAPTPNSIAGQPVVPIPVPTTTVGVSPTAIPTPAVTPTPTPTSTPTSNSHPRAL